MTHSLELYNQTQYTRESLIADVKPHLDPVDLNNVLDAYEMASHVHEYQLRNDATLYFWHITRVASILTRELRYYNGTALIAALLHDVIEDSNIITAEVIGFNFGESVAHIVTVLTKDLTLTGAARAAEEIRYLTAIKEGPIEARIIKFAERLDNFRCLEFGVKRNPFQYIAETEREYFPIAEAERNEHLDALVAAMRLIKGKLTA